MLHGIDRRGADAAGRAAADANNGEPLAALVIKLAELFRLRVTDLVSDKSDSEDQPIEMVAILRDLKILRDEDRETIRMIMETMTNRLEQRSRRFARPMCA